MQRAIIIMAKVPLIGTVKTRLQAALPAEKCAALAVAFLQDTLEKSRSLCKNIILAYAPAAGRELLEEIAGRENIFVEQTGANLGERMANAFEFAFGENSAVLMIGTDSPTFPAPYIEQAFAALENGSEIVLGKSK